MLQAGLNHDVDRLPRRHDSVAWPTFTMPKTKKAHSSGYGRSYDENVDDLLAKAPASCASIKAIDDKRLAKQRLRDLYGVMVMRASLHVMRGYDFQNFSFHAWQCITDEEVLDTVVDKVAPSDTEPGFFDLDYLINEEDQGQAERTRPAAQQGRPGTFTSASARHLHETSLRARTFPSNLGVSLAVYLAYLSCQVVFQATLDGWCLRHDVVSRDELDERCEGNIDEATGRDALAPTTELHLLRDEKA